MNPRGAAAALALVRCYLMMPPTAADLLQRDRLTVAQKRGDASCQSLLAYLPFMRARQRRSGISMTKSNSSPSSDILFIATDGALTCPMVNARVKHSSQRLQSFFHQLGRTTEALGEAPMTKPLPWMIHEIIENIFREGHFLMALCDTAGARRRSGASSVTFP
jgi:hypothetical protein